MKKNKKFKKGVRKGESGGLMVNAYGNERFRLHLVCTSGPRAKYLKFLSGPPVQLRGTYYGVHKYYDFYVFVVVILVLKVKK